MSGNSHVRYAGNQIIDYITASIRETLVIHPEVYAAILMGSCSRGEESYYLDETGVWQLLSDYEFTVVTNKNSIPESVNKDLSELNQKLKEEIVSPFFNLEWNFVWKKKLPLMDKRFINFEMSEAKYLICGDEGVFSLLPKISVCNLNFAELNSVVNHRLYHVLRDFSRISEHQQKYMIARNTLDILSVVLPYEGKLICSYQKRLEQFPTALAGTAFSDDILVRLKNSLEMKRNYSSSLYKEASVDDMLYTFVKDMQNLHDYQKTKQKGKAFSVDRRRLLKAVMKLQRKEIKKVLERPDDEEKLYQEMVNSLKNKTFMTCDFSDRVMELYQYR